jgi:tetratricopeptide (TPR) repeat protein
LLGIALLGAAIPVRGIAQGTTGQDDQFRGFLQKGFELHQNADYSAAIVQLEAAYKLQPHDYFVNLLLGIDTLRNGKASEAAAYLQEASRQRPKEEFPYEYLGETESVLGHPAEAAEMYLHAVHGSPESEQAIESWVDYCLERYRLIDQQLHHTQEGLASEYRLEALAHPLGDSKRQELLQHAAALDPDAAGIWSELALADAAVHSPQAKPDSQRALKVDPQDLRAQEVAALLRAQAGEWKSTSEMLNEVAAHSTGMLLRFAMDWPRELLPPVSTHNAEPAAIFFRCVAGGANAGCVIPPHRQAVAQKPAEELFREQRWEELLRLPIGAKLTPHAWFERGIAYVMLGNCDRAIPALEYAISDLPNIERNRFLLSLCYAIEAGDAANHLNQGTSGSAAIHLMRGDILLRLKGNSVGAEAEYRQALSQRPSDPEILERMAEAELARSDFQAAEENASLALHEDPHRFLALQTLSRVYLRAKNYVQALPYLKQLIAYQPNDPETQVELGTACAQTGELEDSAKYLALALKQRYPDEKGTVHFIFGTVLRRLGRADEAGQVLAQAQQLSDEFHNNAHWERNE